MQPAIATSGIITPADTAAASLVGSMVTPGNIVRLTLLSPIVGVSVATSIRSKGVGALVR